MGWHVRSTEGRLPGTAADSRGALSTTSAQRGSCVSWWHHQPNQSCRTRTQLRTFVARLTKLKVRSTSTCFISFFQFTHHLSHSFIYSLVRDANNNTNLLMCAFIYLCIHVFIYLCISYSCIYVVVYLYMYLLLRDYISICLPHQNSIWWGLAAARCAGSRTWESCWGQSCTHK